MIDLGQSINSLFIFDLCVLLPPKGAIVHVPLIFLFVRLCCLSVLSVLSVAQDELKISKFRVRQKSSFKPETDRESLIFTQKIQVIGRSETFCNVTESNYKICDVKDIV